MGGGDGVGRGVGVGGAYNRKGFSISRLMGL